MYEPLIQLILGKETTAFDDMIFSAVQRAEIVVDKDELLKALQYDRDQYRKGYADGKKDAAAMVHGRWEWFDEDTGTPVTGYEREWGWRCSCCQTELSDDYDDPDRCPEMNYCPHCGAKMDGDDVR